MHLALKKFYGRLALEFRWQPLRPGIVLIDSRYIRKSVRLDRLNICASLRPWRPSLRYHSLMSSGVYSCLCRYCRQGLRSTLPEAGGGLSCNLCPRIDNFPLCRIFGDEAAEECCCTEQGRSLKKAWIQRRPGAIDVVTCGKSRRWVGPSKPGLGLALAPAFRGTADQIGDRVAVRRSRRLSPTEADCA